MNQCVILSESKLPGRKEEMMKKRKDLGHIIHLHIMLYRVIKKYIFRFRFNIKFRTMM